MLRQKQKLQKPTLMLQRYWQRQKRQKFWFRCFFVAAITSLVVAVFLLQHHFYSTLATAEVKGDENKILRGNIGHISRICFIIQPSQVDPGRHGERVDSIKATWASKVPNSQLFFVGNYSYPGEFNLNVLQRDFNVDRYHENFGGYKLLNALIESFERCPKDTLWFAKGDTNTYFIVESLSRYLEHVERKTPNVNKLPPLFLGRRLRPPGNKPEVFNSGGAGYVLSRPAMELIISAQKLGNGPCYNDIGAGNMNPSIGDDLVVSACLRSVGIKPMETRDDHGSERFHGFGPGRLALNKLHDWYTQYTFYPIRQDDGTGGSCCASGTVSFHYVEKGSYKVY
mmetsp:Transcript_10172/g.11752  ORF Transcript_10172/g.11752 Transcript_10172/m.11752 type:complete len:340 (+) Transcript_10172:115-1134(+)